MKVSERVPGHGLLGVADAGAFLARLVRLDPASLVRLRSTTADSATGVDPATGPDSAATADSATGPRTALWAVLPWEILVTREVAGAGPADATVSAAELLSRLAAGDAALPARRDAQWRWPLPPPRVPAVESVAVAELSRLAAAAAGTLREAESGGVGGRAVGRRALRDALLDHVALVVTRPDAEPVRVSQRLVQAVSRMGFLGPAGVDCPEAWVCAADRWVGISAPYGIAWLQTVNTLTVSPIRYPPVR